VKIAIIALSAAALIAVTPSVLAKGVASKTPSPHHKFSEKHHARISGYAPLRETPARGWTRSYPGASGYVLGQPGGLNRDLESSRQAGGGGGGGGGGGM
jgi:hypothetical protein